MSIFDNLRSPLPAATGKAARPVSNGSETFIFAALPESLVEMQAMPEAGLTTPFQTAALTVCSLCAYGADKRIGLDMLNWLRGPRPLSGHEISFLDDRFRDEKWYVPFSYFKGATPENDYTPSQPFTVTFSTNPHSADNEGYMKLFVESGGADNPRAVTLRVRGDGKWFLWEQYLMPDIRPPKSRDPWA